MYIYFQIGQALESIDLMQLLYKIRLFLIENMLLLRRIERDLEIPASLARILINCLFQINFLSKVYPRYLAWLVQETVVFLIVIRFG